MRKSLKTRLIVIISVLTAVLLMAEGFIVLKTTQNNYKDSLDETYAAQTQYYSSVINSWLLQNAGSITAEISIVAAAESTADVPKLITALTDLTNNSDAITMAYIAFTSGNLVNGSGWVPDEGWDPRERSWYTTAVANNGTLTYSSPYVDDNTGNMVVTISQYFKAGLFEGVAAIDLDMSVLLADLPDLVSRNGNEGDYVIVAAADGTMIYHKDKSLLPTPQNPKLNIKDLIDGAYSSAIETDDAFEDYDGTTCYITATKNYTTGWTVALVSPATYYDSKVKTNRDIVFIIFVVCIVVAIAVSVVVSRMIAQPIVKASRQVEEMSEDIASGNADLTRRIETKSQDEIGALVSGVNELTDALSDVIRNINDAAGDLANGVGSLEKAAGVTSDNVATISSTMEEMSASSEETSASTAQVSQQVNDIAGLTEKVNSNTNEKTQEISRNLKKVDELKNRIEADDANMMDRLNKAIASMNEKIKATKKVEDIQKMTEGISDVASQTNLLSLNASIEAARAGEAGKGFAVVADEIGKLANNSANMAQNIQQVSDEVLAIVDQLVKTAEEVSNIMLTITKENSDEKASLIEEYIGALNTCFDSMSAISDDTTEISTSIGMIRDSVSAIDIAVDENAKGATNVAQGAAELVGAANDVTGSAKLISEASAKLQDKVSGFKF